MSATSPPGALNHLQQYQQQLQGSMASQLAPQLFNTPQRLSHAPLSSQQQQTPPSNVSIAAQQQQQLMSKAMEKQSSELQLDKLRVTLLLEINAELLREVLNVQPKLKSPEEAKNDPVFRECMRRLQQNLAYLAAIADRSHKPAALIPVCPGVLVAPPDMPTLERLYKQLQDLYPGINPANPPPQQGQQAAQIGAARPGQTVSPKSHMPQGASMGMPPPSQGSPRDNILSSSPPPPQLQSHQSPPPMQILQHQQPPSTPHQQQLQQQMMYAQSHAHSQSPPLQDPRIQQQQQHQQQQQQHQQQQQQQHQQHQQQQQHYAALQQQQHRQLMMQRAQQQQQHQQHLQQQQMGIPTNMGMNGMQASMTPQGINQGMMGGAAGMGMGGGMPMNNYGGMTHMNSMGQMGGAPAPMGQMGMGGQMIGNMGVMPPGGGFDSMGQGMWNPAWQGGGA